MAFFKYSPDLMSSEELELLSVGRQNIVNYTIEKIQNTIKNRGMTNLLFIGQRGIGKSHLLLRIMHKLDSTDVISPIRFSEEEYSISTLEQFFSRALDILNIKYSKNNVVSDAKKIFKELQKKKKTPIIFVENLQMLFDQMNEDLSKLRSILQEEKSFFIIGSALSTFDEIISPNEPFYNFFEITRIPGLKEDEILELIKKRLEHADKKELVTNLSKNKERIKGLQILTGGNPRLVHILCEIIIQKSTLEDLEKNLLHLLDQMTPFYQARMETLSKEKRKIINTLALASGPLTPTELAKILQMKNTIVISQLHRLQDDGYVESIKFKNKKATRYQIVERLYRIWRELRTTKGAAKVKLFVEFLKVWYSEDELKNEYHSLSTQIDDLLINSDNNAIHKIKRMCYILNTMPDFEIMNLEDVIEKFAKAGDYDSAEEEILKISKLYEHETNESILHAVKILVKISRLQIMTTTPKSYYDLYDEIQDSLKKLSKKKTVLPQDEIELAKIHQFYEILAGYCLEQSSIDLAQYFNDIASDCIGQHYCPIVMNQNALIAIQNKNYDQVLLLANEISKKEKNPANGLNYKIIAYTRMGNKSEAIKHAKKLIEIDIQHLTTCLYPFVEFELIDELLPILSLNLTRIEKLNPSKISELAINLVYNFNDYMFHEIMEDKPVEKYVKCVELLKKYLNNRDVIETIGKILTIHRDDFKYFPKFFSVLESIFDSKSMEGLKPVNDAIHFIGTQDTDVFETLHPEHRELVVSLINRLSPETKIPQSVIDSL